MPENGKRFEAAITGLIEIGALSTNSGELYGSMRDTGLVLPLIDEFFSRRGWGTHAGWDWLGSCPVSLTDDEVSHLVEALGSQLVAQAAEKREWAEFPSSRWRKPRQFENGSEKFPQRGFFCDA